MTQSQKQKQSQKQSQKQKQTQVGVQAEIPLFIDNIEEDDILETDEDIAIDQNEDDSIELPDDIEEEEKISYFEGVEISGDIENYRDENISIPFRHYPIAEINFDGSRLFIAPRRSIMTSNLLAMICQEIILTNKKFLIEESDVRNIQELTQTELIAKAKFKIDKTVLSRVIQHNYITLPNGIDYPLSIFFSHTVGRKTKNEDEIENFFKKIMTIEQNDIENNRKEGAEITIDLLYSDSKIAEEFSNEFNKIDRRTIARYRVKCNVKPIEDRLSDYKMKYNS